MVRAGLASARRWISAACAFQVRPVPTSVGASTDRRSFLLLLLEASAIPAVK